MKIKMKEKVIWAVVLFVVISGILYFVPIPKKISKSLDGNNAVISLELKKLNYLFKEDKVTGKIIIKNENDDTMTYTVDSVINLFGDEKDIYWSDAFHYSEDKNRYNGAYFFYTYDFNNVLITSSHEEEQICYVSADKKYLEKMMLISGCETNEVQSETHVEDTVIENTDTGYAKDFLTEFFLFNKDNRYSDLEVLDEAGLSQYYDSFSSMVTSECMEELKANRVPVSYDKVIFENKLIVTVGDIELKLYDEDTGAYEYTVELKVSSDNSEENSISALGQVSIDDSGKVSNIYIKQNQDFLNKLVK